MNRRTLIKGLAATALAAATGTTIDAWDTHRVEVAHVSLTLRLQRPLRAAVLGDVHFDPVCDEEYLRRVITQVTNLDPDMVFFLGDLVTGESSRYDDLAAILARAESRYGSFAVMGNHEHIAGATTVARALEKRGIRVLLNDSVPLPGEDDYYLTGIDSYWGSPDLSVFNRTPALSRHILLAHEPDPFHRLNEPRVTLQLSGHTHGGQVRFPVRGALHLPILGRKYDQGLYTRDGRFLYVNRGIGTLPPHFRFDCAPEITVFEMA